MSDFQNNTNRVVAPPLPICTDHIIQLFVRLRNPIKFLSKRPASVESVTFHSLLQPPTCEFRISMILILLKYLIEIVVTLTLLSK